MATSLGLVAANSRSELMRLVLMKCYSYQKEISQRCPVERRSCCLMVALIEKHSMRLDW